MYQYCDVIYQAGKRLRAHYMDEIWPTSAFLGVKSDDGIWGLT